MPLTSQMSFRVEAWQWKSMPLTSQMSFRVVGLGSLAVEEHVAYITNEL